MKKIYVFPDGSYRKTYMIPIIPQNRDMLLEAIGDEKKVDSLLAPKSSSFSIQSQTLDIWVQDGTLQTQGGFSVNFYLSDTNQSVINYVYGASVWCLVGSSDPTTWQLSIPAKKEIDFAYCHAKLRYVWLPLNGQYTCYTHFYISGGQYWTEFEI